MNPAYFAISRHAELVLASTAPQPRPTRAEKWTLNQVLGDVWVGEWRGGKDIFTVADSLGGEVMTERSRNALVDASAFMIPFVTIIVFRDWYDDGQIATGPEFFVVCFAMFLGAWSASWLRKVAND